MMKARLLSLSWMLIALTGACSKNAPPPEEPSPAVADAPSPEPDVAPEAEVAPPIHPDREPPDEAERDIVTVRAGQRCVALLDYDGSGDAPPEHVCHFGKVCRPGHVDEFERRAFARVGWGIMGNGAVAQRSPGAWVAAQQCAAAMTDPAEIDAFVLQSAQHWSERDELELLLACAEHCAVGDEARERLWEIEGDRGRSARIAADLAALRERLEGFQTPSDVTAAIATLGKAEADAAKLRDPQAAQQAAADLDATRAALTQKAEPLMAGERAKFPATMKRLLGQARKAIAATDAALRSKNAHRFDVLYGKFDQQPVSERLFELDRAFEAAHDQIEYGRTIVVDTARAQEALTKLERKAQALRDRADARYAELDAMASTGAEMCSLASDGEPPQGADRKRWNELAKKIRKAGLTPPKASECYMK